uniref:Calpain 10 n=1 Tax=Monodelphis domestica TaxID=13616 RepID=A0A5F8G904_MONDO
MPAGGGEPPSRREYFKDATFPASDSSLFCTFATPLAQFREEITWLRPQMPVSGWPRGASSLLHLEPLLSCVPHRYAQEVSQMCRLSAGNYRIVPSTYLPDTEGDFTIIIATQIDRRPIRSQETLGQLLQEVSFTAVMKR